MSAHKLSPFVVRHARNELDKLWYAKPMCWDTSTGLVFELYDPTENNDCYDYGFDYNQPF